MAKANATVCGIPTRVGKRASYGGGNIYPGARAIGSVAPISTASAKHLVRSLFGHERLPRMGYELTLCTHQYLSNTSGKLEVVRRASGEFQGARSRSRSRR